MSTTAQGLILALSTTFVVAGLAVDASDASPATSDRPSRVAPSTDPNPRWQVELDLEAAATPAAAGAFSPDEVHQTEVASTVQS